MNFFKNSSKKYLEEVVKTFNVIFEKREIDKSFLNSIIYAIHKKGDKSIVSNYRGISFMNCIAKILMGVINQRMYDWAERKNVLTECQAGFRKNYSTADNIYNLAAIAHIQFSKNKKLYAFFCG